LTDIPLLPRQKLTSYLISPHQDFINRTLSFAFFHIDIFSSTFYHLHFFIRILSSAFFHPYFAIRHPPSAIRSLVYRYPFGRHVIVPREYTRQLSLSMCETFKWIKLLVVEAWNDGLQIPLKSFLGK